MPATTIANACELGPDMPIRPRNPYPRGTPRYTKRQNINRNVRLHLRNDRKILQHDALINKLVHDTHFSFYHALSNFDQWRHTRQLLPHDRTLIREWVDIYSDSRKSILQLQALPDTHRTTQMMTRLLVQYVKRTLSIAETGTLVREPIALSYPLTPLNEQRMEHFCNYLHDLILEPLTTPAFKEPNLDMNLRVYGDIVNDILAAVDAQLL